MTSKPTTRALIKNKLQITGIVGAGLLFGAGLYASYQHHKIKTFEKNFQDIISDRYRSSF